MFDLTAVVEWEEEHEDLLTVDGWVITMVLMIPAESLPPEPGAEFTEAEVPSF